MFEVTTDNGAVLVNAWAIASIEEHIHAGDYPTKCIITMKTGKEIRAHESYDWVQHHFDQEIESWKTFKREAAK